MKTDDFTFTVAELNELCRLYMDCKLSVLQEKELEFVLSATTLSSPAINEVRGLIGLPLLNHPQAKTQRKLFSRRVITGIAASVAIFVAAAFYFATGFSGQSSTNGSDTYIAAYSHGQALAGLDAELATDRAIARADSLMNLASLTEHDYMMKANDIISETFNN